MLLPRKAALLQNKESQTNKIDVKLSCSYKEVMTYGLEWIKSVVYFSCGVKHFKSLAAKERKSQLNLQIIALRRKTQKA